MNYLEVNVNNFWKQVFYNSEDILQAVKIENSNFQQEIAVKIKKPMHVDGCDTIFMEDELIIVDVHKKVIKEVIKQNTATILEDIIDVAAVLLEIELYNKKNQIANLRKKFNSNKKSQY